MIYQAEHINDIYKELCDALKRIGKVKIVKGQKTLELSPVLINLLDVKNDIVTLPGRNINYDYIKDEKDWYLSGSLIPMKYKLWQSIADSDGKVNSNYGYFVFFQKTKEEMTQYEWCRKKLSEDLYTRQAVINYNQLMHKYDTKDFPCTVSQQFLVNDGKLDTFVNMRSNDLIYGFAYDIIWFIYVQHVLAKDLGLSPGKYWHFTPSLHVYEKDMKIIESICSGD